MPWREWRDKPARVKRALGERLKAFPEDRSFKDLSTVDILGWVTICCMCEGGLFPVM